MKNIVIAAFLAALWTAAHVVFFKAFHAMLGLDLSPMSALVIVLVSAWFFTLVLFFRSWIVRLPLMLTYLLVMGWSLVNYAYFEVFKTFLGMTSSRFLSVNAAVLRVVKDYAALIPTGLLIGAVGLLILLVVIDRTAARIWRAREVVSVHLVPEREKRYAPPGAAFRRRLLMASLGILAQVAFLLSGLVVVRDIRAELAASQLDPAGLLSRLGLIGYAFASERPHPEESAIEERIGLRPVAAASGLTLSRSGFDVIREDMATLASYGPVQTAATHRPDIRPQHVILYQLESVSDWPLHQDPSPMPFLASLLERYGGADTYFANGCTTVDAEFAVNCGFLPETYGPVSDLYAKNTYHCLPTILKEEGFATTMYHANDDTFWARDLLAPAWGYDTLKFTPYFDYRTPDSAVLNDVITDIQRSDTPTLHYVIGLVSHAPHNEHFRDFYNRVHGLGIAPYEGPLNGLSADIDVDEETLRMYLGFLRATDDGIRYLFTRLEETGHMGDTMVVIYGDHRYYDAKDGDPVGSFLTYDRIPMVFYAPGTDGSRPSLASHIDVPSTVYDLVTGGAKQLPPTFLGTSLYAPEREDGVVTKCLGRVSYYDGKNLLLGDLLLDRFWGFTRNGKLADGTATAMTKVLKDVAMTSDLMMSRDLLGPTSDDGVDGDLRYDMVTDSDGDGISDLREKAIHTDPHSADTDGDGFSDGEEVKNGYDPNGPGKLIRRSTE